MNNRPLEGVAENELRIELQRRRVEKKRQYTEWLLLTRPKRARFIKYFNFAQPFPALMFIGPVVVVWVIGALFPSIAKQANAVGIGTGLLLLVFCFIGSFVEAFCKGAFRKMYPND